MNDRPLDVAAIVERGRVLLPMRATFAALGASVGYEPSGRVVIARNSEHALRLRIGSRDAVVDGHHVTLDVAARIVATRTYVPLRFVAQAMGAVVGYDARARLVSVVSSSGAAGVHSRNVSVLALSPTPQSVVSSAYPTVSASLGTESASRADVTLTIDGQDVTALASFDGTTITYMPRIGLTPGSHTAMFYGKTAGGDRFSSSWTFVTSRPAPPDAPALSFYDYRFYSNGPLTYYPGDWMHFVLIAPPGGSAQLELCGMGYEYALWNSGNGNMYEADFPVPRGYWIPSCSVTATYVGWNGQRYYVPAPVIIGIYTGNNPAPTPKPTGSPRSLPPEPRRPEPTPAPVHTVRPLPIETRPPATPAPTPVPVPTAAPTAAPTPRPVPHPRPVPRPVPHPRETP